jgi:1-deoxy-D-xylulose-5-phosphate synthase
MDYALNPDASAKKTSSSADKPVSSRLPHITTSEHMIATPLLDTIAYPADLRKLTRAQLPQLCDELRQFILHSVASTGGHLASNLGAVEITVALHYVFDTPNDRLVWDVGHQCYPHKILTGRRAGMAKLRMWEGLSGFPTRKESEYDAFGVAHSSTSISAALGMAVGAKLLGKKQRSVAIIGDGAMSAGMAFEALNNAGAMDVPLLVILNDNDMSISEPVGALNNYLARLLVSNSYNKIRRVGEKMLKKFELDRFGARWEEHLKGMVVPGTLFEEFGFNYIGPMDGHDILLLVDAFTKVKDRDGQLLLHVVTKKGGGYEKAEADPILYHGVSKFDPVVGIIPKPPGKPTFSDVFGQWLCDMAAADDNLVAITPAMREGSGMVEFSKQFPSRYFDVGIAEQHAVTYAAGLACEGVRPVVAIYSTFLQRAYDQLVHDVVLQNLPVVFAIDRAGLVGADGPTHAGSFDIAFLRCLPNMVIMCPSDEAECRAMLTTAYRHNGPSAVRYPRGAGIGAPMNGPLTPLPLGKGEIIVQGSGSIAILAFGTLLHAAKPAAQNLNATLVNMRYVKPLDVALIRAVTQNAEFVITLEDHATQGGAGSAVSEAMCAAGFLKKTLHIGLSDTFIDQGDPAILMREAGLDVAGIERQIRAFVGR